MSDDVSFEPMEIEAPGTGTTSAASSSTSVIIPPELSADVSEWDEDDVETFLEQNQKKYHLKESHIDIVKNQEVAGVALLDLTEEKLLKEPYSLKGGPAAAIAKLVEKLKENKGLVERVIPLKRSYQSTAFGEGPDELCYISDERLAMFDNWMTKNPIGLLRSPPYSGKTTLAFVLGDYLRNKGHTVIIVSMLNLREWRGDKGIEAFNDYWIESGAAKSWTECVKCNAPTDVLIDEAQILYGSVDFFWNRLKSLMQQVSFNPYLRLLLLSMYGDSGVGTPSITATPIHFLSALGLDDLRMRRNEFETVTNKFINLSGSGNLAISIPDTVRDAIFNITLGHPGLVRQTLSSLRFQYRRGLRDVPGMLRYLVSPDYRDAIKESRAFVWVKDRQFNRNETEFLRNALYQMDSNSTFPVVTDNGTVSRIISSFKHSGLVTQTGNGSPRLQFAAPLVRVVLGQRLFTAPATLSNLPKAKDFENFLIMSIRRIRPSVLSESLSKSLDSRLYERAWQMEWYRAASTAVPGLATISPDVGPIFGTTGFLDFYVNSGLEWGVELLREGDKMEKHARRFVDGGTYEDIPLKHWVIIDFRHKSKRVQQAKPNFWHVLYDDEYSKVEIRCKGLSSMHVTLGEGLDVTLNEADLVQ